MSSAPGTSSGSSAAGRGRRRAASSRPAERRVADLAAGGATNREIARRLFLSPKTIEMHLRSVYRKLDIAGREGLASRVRYRVSARR